MSTRNQAESLKLTLSSIYSQNILFDYEVIVVDDGSTDHTKSVCEQYGVQYIYLDNSFYRNPAVARNTAYKAAKGKIVIAQSADVLHRGEAVTWLTLNLRPNELLFAKVYNVNPGTWLPVPGTPIYCGPERPEPRFFLGALWRKDIYAIGGNDERFIYPGWEDDWFGECLTKGLGRVPRYATEAVGWHQAHSRKAPASGEGFEMSHQLYLENVANKVYTNEPWAFE